MSKIEPIQHMCGMDIDMSKVTFVGNVGGDRAWRRYTVYMEGSRTIDFYTGRTADQMYLPREDFIKLWKSTK